MKALSIRPDPAEAIAFGKKRIENRSWYTHYRGPLAIHRSGKNGAIIAIADLVEIYHSEELRQEYPKLYKKHKDYIDDGSLCWLLAKVVPLEREIPCKGALKLWEFPEKRLPSAIRKIVKERLAKYQ